MLDWITKGRGKPDHPMHSAASAAALLAELRGKDALGALDDLSGWLESLKDAAGFADSVKGEVLGLIQGAGEPHVTASLASYVKNLAEKPITREAKWKAVFDYASVLSEVLCDTAEQLAAAAKADAHLRSAAAVAAVRGLAACHTLAKVCLMRYLSVPAELWRRAYAVHTAAEAGAFAGSPVSLHGEQQPSTSAIAELLRLLMLQSSMPDMLSPEQIEVAERAILQLGADFTLRAADVADTPFCFDASGGRPPRRASAGQSAGARYFGPGPAFDALVQLYKQMATEKLSQVKTFGKDITPQAQLSAVEHLLRFWGPNPAYSPPAHSPLSDQLLVAHRFEQICRHFPDVATTIERSSALAMTETEETKPEPPETWTVKDAGGNELGAEFPQLTCSWAKAGDLVGVSMQSQNAWWVGAVRRMHAERGGSMHADIAIFSRKPVAMKLRILGKDIKLPEGWETSSDAFAYRYIDAILLPDASEKSGKLNLLLPAEGWKIRQVYEATAWEPSRYLRVVRLLKRGPDYARVEFEWLSLP